MFERSDPNVRNMDRRHLDKMDGKNAPPFISFNNGGCLPISSLKQYKAKDDKKATGYPAEISVSICINPTISPKRNILSRTTPAVI